MTFYGDSSVRSRILLTAMRTGVTPGGRQLRGEFMPGQTRCSEMTEEAAEAIWLYARRALETLPRGVASPAGGEMQRQ